MFYNIKNWHTPVKCDHEGAIHMSKMILRRLHLGSSCADFLRNLHKIRNNMSVTIKYQHEDSHMDKYLLWCHIALEQKMNIRCVNLSKRSGYRVIVTGMKRKGNQLLPSGDTPVSVNNRKLVRDLAKSVRHEVGKGKVRDHLAYQDG